MRCLSGDDMIVEEGFDGERALCDVVMKRSVRGVSLMIVK